MNKEEYVKAEKALKEEFEEKRKQLAREFASSNNPVKIGDVIKDHYKIIRVEKFFLTTTFKGTPILKYRGTRLTAKCEPAKRNKEDNAVYQNNITEINGIRYKFEE